MLKNTIFVLFIMMIAVPAFAIDKAQKRNIENHIITISYQSNHLRALYEVSKRRENKSRTSELCVSIIRAQAVIRNLRLSTLNDEGLKFKTSEVLDLINGANAICDDSYRRKNKYKAFSIDQAIEMDLLINGDGGIKQVAKELIDQL